VVDDARWRLGDELLVRSEFAEARRTFERVRREAGEPVPLGVDIGFCARMAQILIKVGRYEEALTHCRRGIAIAREPEHVGLLRGWAGIAHATAGRPAAARTEIVMGWRDLGDRRGIARVILERAEGNACADEGQWRRAIDAFSRGLEACTGLDVPWERSIAQFNIGDAYSALGAHGQARNHLFAAFEVKSELGDRWGLAHIHRALVRLHFDRGEVDEAALQCEAGRELARTVGDPKLEAAFMVEHGRLALRRNELDQAQVCCSEARRLARSCGARSEELGAQLLTASILLRQGDAARALAALKPVLSEAAEYQASFEASVAHRLAALSHLETGNFDGTRRALTNARRLARSHGNPYRRLELDVIELRLRRREGELEGFADRLEAVQDRASALSAAAVLTELEHLRNA
jgi:tetratricopeptide (TPR) repeat protein